jgi:hypothetical protein
MSSTDAPATTCPWAATETIGSTAAVAVIAYSAASATIGSAMATAMAPVLGAPPGPDILAGGFGSDEVSYEDRVRSVSVDLVPGRSSGEPGEGDQLSGIESVVGGQAPDRLAGNRRSNVLDGLARPRPPHRSWR